MASKRIENSKQRLFEKIEEGKKYLQEKENNYDINDLTKLRNHISKKKAQFERDLQSYESEDDKDEDNLIAYQNFQEDADELLDDIEHYIDVTKEQRDAEERKEQRDAEQRKLKLQREAEERKEQREAEERKEQREAEERKEQREADDKKRAQEFELERLRIEAEVSKEKCKAEIVIATSEKKNVEKQQPVRLPKLELKKFYGDLLKWQSFWDSFESTIHKNDTLNDIDKLNYLRSLLQGDALRTIAGLELTNSNYDVAIDILKERYGNKEVITQNHYNKLNDLESATENIHSLRFVYDTIEQHLRSLEALGEDIDHQQFVSLIKRKFPQTVNEHITHHNKNPDEAWTVKKLRKAIRNYITTKEIATQEQPKSSDSRRNDHRGGTTGLYADSKQRNLKCIFCGKEHWNDECKTVSSVKERKEKLKSKGKCFNCLRPRHQGKCKRQKPCHYCKKVGHNRALCLTRDKREPKNAENGMIAGDESENEEETLIEEEGLLSAGENVIMQTALIEAMDGDESTSETTRVLMDTGSSRTYITQDLVEKLKLKTEDKNRLTVFTFGGKKPKEMTSPVVTIVLKSKDGNTLKVKANVVPKICAQINRHPVHLEDKMKFQRAFRLADTLPTSREVSTIGVLIGSDYYNDVMTGERKQVQDGLFVLKSKFGWVVSGRTKGKDKHHSESTLFVMTHSASHILPEIQQVTVTDKSQLTPPNLEDFWSLETIGIKPDEPENTDEIATEMFKDTVTKEGQRYFVRWPWRDEDHDLLPENYELSLGRLKSLTKRLEKDPDLLKRYDEIIQTQLAKGMVEKVDVSEMNNENKKHYIPHHVVVKPDSATTKLRVVYDASAKTKKGNKSLNECLYRGPVIMEDLCGLLLRFRTQNIGIVSDIEKAFLQIGIQEDQRDVTRFLWLKDIDKPVTDDNLQIYRFARVPFGIISSPFLLGATIQHHLEESDNPVAEKIKDNIYVDNIITGANSKDEAINLYKNAKDLFRDASMNLREWMTSSKEVNSQIATEDRVESTITKVLGLNWNTETDDLSISTKKFNSTNQTTTKREILAAIASIYDPLGMMSPAIIKLKIFLQQLWKKDMDWDDPLSKEDKELWLELTKDLKDLATIRIPRFIGNEKPQLLGFCDASKKAYATAIYLRTEIEGKHHVNLIFAKTRNAPKEKKIKAKKAKTKKGKKGNVKKKKIKREKMTIPRLELMSSLIATRALRFIAKELELTDKQMTLWTDSKCVLDWLKQKDNKDVFVRNRVKEIIKENDINFRYINTKHNPADIPTKGMTTEELKISSLWWHGPEWLKKNEDQWPTWDVNQINKETIEETLETKGKGTDVIFETSIPAATADEETADNCQPPFGIQAEKYSTIKDLLRITAYVNRYQLKLRKKITTKGQLTAEEIEAAKTLWIKYLQRKHYLTTNKGEVELNMKTTPNSLNPQLDKEGLIRCHSRLTNADLPREMIEPILLPRKERFVQLMIEDTHRKLFHAGVNHTLSEMRTQYWIPQGRAEVKYTLKRCRICRKHQGGPYKMPAMSPWPKSKLIRSVPFDKTGLDYFGPLFVKQTDGSHQKVWVCLFTCVVVRAIHLEIVNDLTAEEFIMALRRFIARRGKPSNIISDNAPQFKLANSTVELAWNKVITDEAVTSYIANEGIKWSFIVELSPWMGGFYERMVGSSKTALKKAIGQKLLTPIQLQTYLTETEAILNTRPLVYIGEDLNDGTIITPSHFLSPNTKTGVPTLEEEEEINDPTYVDGKMESKEVLLEKWKTGQRMLEAFWKIWRNDYLLNLRERSKTHLTAPRIQAHEKPNVGDIVQLKEDSPRGSWKLGKITELITSSDGNIRSAKVLLATKNVVNRSLNLLYPLECQNDHTDNLNEKVNQNNDNNEDTTNDTHENNVNQTNEHEAQPPRRSTRRAALEARDRIYGQNWIDE